MKGLKMIDNSIIIIAGNEGSAAWTDLEILESLTTSLQAMPKDLPLLPNQ